MGWPRGLEPPTSGTTTWRSNRTELRPPWADQHSCPEPGAKSVAGPRIGRGRDEAEDARWYSRQPRQHQGPRARSPRRLRRTAHHSEETGSSPLASSSISCSGRAVFAIWPPRRCSTSGVEARSRGAARGRAAHRPLRRNRCRCSRDRAARNSVDDPRFAFHHIDVQNDLYNPEDYRSHAVELPCWATSASTSSGSSRCSLHLTPNDYAALLRLLRRYMPMTAGSSSRSTSTK